MSFVAAQPALAICRNKGKNYFRRNATCDAKQSDKSKIDGQCAAATDTATALGGNSQPLRRQSRGAIFRCALAAQFVPLAFCNAQHTTHSTVALLSAQTKAPRCPPACLYSNGKSSHLLTKIITRVVLLAIIFLNKLRMT